MIDINGSNISDILGWTCSPIWREFALEKNGAFDEGNIIRDQSIKIKNGEGYIYYRAYRRANDKRGMNTLITASYIAENNFYFNLRRKGNMYTPFVYLNKLKTVKIDNEIFDRFIVRTNDENALNKLFKDNDIIGLISSQDLFCMEIKRGINLNEKILYLEINGIVDSYKGMEETFSLTTKIINKIK